MSASRGGGAGAVRVLVVLSESGEAGELSRGLELALPGARVRAATDALSFRAALEEGAFDVALVGGAVPWVPDGWKRLLRRDRLDGPWVLVASGAPDREPRGVCLRVPRDAGAGAVAGAVARVVQATGLEPGADGRAAGPVVAARDVGERRGSLEALRASEARLRLMVRQIPAVLWTVDAELRITSSQGAGLAALGLQQDQLNGLPLVDYFGRDDLPPVEAHRRALRGESVAYDLVWQSRSYQCHLEPLLGPGGEVAGVLGMALDVTERERAFAALRASERRYRLLFERNLAGVYRSTLGGRILDCNDACARIFGYASREELLQRPAASLYPQPQDRAAFLARLQEQKTLSSVEARYRTRDGALIWAVESVTLLEDVEAGAEPVLEGTLIDITGRKRAEAQVQYQAHHDALTGLPNRALLMDRLGQALASAHRHRRQLAVMFLDLDHFKLVNDTLGHSVGDVLLRTVAQRLQAAVREEDTVARVGGDEFTLLLPQLAGAQDAVHIAEKVLAAVAQPLQLEGQDLSITTSIGISIHPGDGADAETLLKNADGALYRAKELGRNGYQLCTVETSSRALERLGLENRLRRALERDEMLVYYQPLVDARSRRIVGFEGLVRWLHPERGIVEPDAFVPLAEQSRLVIPLGEWVLRTACRQMRRWHDAGHPGLRLSVNLSGRQLQEFDLASTVEAALRDSGLAAGRLEMEITETVAMQNAEWTAELLRVLRLLGVRIALDDFGTGQSALSYLKRFPLSAIKIDRSFVKDIVSDPDDEVIVKAVVALAHTLKLHTIAEGVETAEQFAAVRAAGCDEVQGYLFSPPLPAEEVLPLLQRGVAGGPPAA